LPKWVMTSVYVLLIAVGIVAMYSILNAGHPGSLLRSVFPDPSVDVYIAVISSLVVFILGFVVFFKRDSQGFQSLVERNGERVRNLRKEGKTDQEIAESILTAMGSHGGYKHDLAKKKLLIYLKAFRS